MFWDNKGFPRRGRPPCAPTCLACSTWWKREIEPGRVFDLELPLERVAEAYEAMDDRCAIKVLLRP